MGPFAGQILSSLTLDDLKRLVGDGVAEQLHLDYKRELSIDEKDAKKEFLRDVTAMANAQGGMILFGVDEERDVAGKPTGLPKSVDGFVVANRDAFLLSLEHLIKDGIDERLPSYELATISLASDRLVLLLRVPASLRAPHMVTLGGERRFFMRGNSGRQEMSTAQIRDSVLRTQSITERLQIFVRGRIEKLRKESGGIPFWTLHVVPLVRDHSALDVTDQQVVQRLRKVGSPRGGDSIHCIEGFKVFEQSKSYKSHALFFRDGTMEFFDQYVFMQQDNSTKYFACGSFDGILFQMFAGAMGLYNEARLQPPAVVFVTLCNVEGFMIPPERFSFGQARVSTASDVDAEGVMIMNLPADGPTVLRPILDFIWNAFGYPKCSGYDESGKYIGYR